MIGSSQVFKVIPFLDRKLSPEEFQVWSKLRLGYPIFKKAVKCEYCEEVSDVYGQHFLKCTKATSVDGFIARHNRFRDVVAEVGKEIGCKVEVELKDILNNNERPADIYISNDLTKLAMAVDVSLTSPHVTFNSSVDSKIGNAADVREIKKTKLYGPRLLSQGITCAPYVIEHYGGFTKLAEADVIHELALAWSMNQGLPFDHCKKNLIDRFTFAHAKIISSIFVRRTAAKKIDNDISTDHAMYDGSSGFRNWANVEKKKRSQVSMGPLGGTPELNGEWDTSEPTGDWENVENGKTVWGADPSDAVPSWD